MAHADLKALAEAARWCRVQILRMLAHAGSGHPGGSLSVIDLLAVLYGNRMRHDPKRPDWPDRDRFILSKGHCVPAQYSSMARAGYFPESLLITLRKLGSPLQGHPDPAALPGIEAATGSLGQGLSIAVGMALGIRLAGRACRVYCIVGDGEIQEGQVWEAAMSAPKLGAPDRALDNLCVVVDRNGIQLDGFVKQILDLEPLVDKWKAFGWAVLEIDGHDLAQIDKAFDEAESIKGRPTCIVAHTVKGKGVSFMENDPEWHGKAPKPAEAIAAIREVLGASVPAWAEPILAELTALEARR
jgi:transketolase